MPHRLLPLSLVVLAGLWTPAYDGGNGSVAATDPLPGNVQRLIDRHECSATGFDTVTPASALVRRPSGRLRLVSYERDLFALARAGDVIAVCLDDPPGAGQSRTTTRWGRMDACRLKR